MVLGKKRRLIEGVRDYFGFGVPSSPLKIVGLRYNIYLL
jgi:hypothetical protein